MVVTFDVSKLSGWLNAFAYCRESKGGHTVRGEVRAAKGKRALGVCRFAGKHGEGTWKTAVGRKTAVKTAVGRAGHARSALRTFGSCS